MNTGTFDQMEAHVRDMVALVRVHYIQCIKQGFSDYEALALAVDFQRGLMAGQAKQD